VAGDPGEVQRSGGVQRLIVVEGGKRRGWLTDFHISRRTATAASPSLKAWREAKAGFIIGVRLYIVL